MGSAGSQDADRHGNGAMDVEDDVTGCLAFKLDKRELIGWLALSNKYMCLCVSPVLTYIASSMCDVLRWEQLSQGDDEDESTHNLKHEREQQEDEHRVN